MINFYKINPDTFSRNKTIMMFHGWGSSIESQIQLGKQLSELGFKIVIPEMIYHDSRQPIRNHFDQKVLHKYFWKTIFETIDEEDVLINCLNLSKENTILFGSSMGGFIASGLYFSNAHYAGLININGSSSFIYSEEDFRIKDGRDTLDDKELALFKKYDPKFKKNNTKNPVLFLHGEIDNIIPITGQLDFISTKKCNTSFLKYKGVNHTIPNRMKYDLINWLNKHF